MTYRAEGTGAVVIEPEPDMVCELCSKVAETRPYGPGGKRVCFECGMADEPLTRHNMNARLYGEGVIR